MLVSILEQKLYHAVPAHSTITATVRLQLQGPFVQMVIFVHKVSLLNHIHLITLVLKAHTVKIHLQINAHQELTMLFGQHRLCLTVWKCQLDTTHQHMLRLHSVQTFANLASTVLKDQSLATKMCVQLAISETFQELNLKLTVEHVQPDTIVRTRTWALSSAPLATIVQIASNSLFHAL